jgi:hypothetical protein
MHNSGEDSGNTKITRVVGGSWAPKTVLLGFLAGSLLPARAEGALLPDRVQKVVLHVLGHPSYDKPRLRFVFFTPRETLAFWRRGFGAHWIVERDGSVWPRKTGEEYFPQGTVADGAWAERLVDEATPVYSHVFRGNSDSVGIEIAHSGRSAEPFPDPQVRSVAWLLRSLMALSAGRLEASSLVGHKDLDQRPAFASESCQAQGCPVFVDSEGQPYRRRVDPPESLFRALESAGIRIPRPPNGDAELLRAEALPAGVRPRVRKP